jgi:hypothetical protein
VAGLSDEAYLILDEAWPRELETPLKASIIP